MNIRKAIDYSELFAAVERAVSACVPQMELYRELGRLVSERPEKGAAVAVSEYLRETRPVCSGFSPRNLRRMRDFYRLYEDYPDLMAQAMRLKWTQNVVIMEASLTVEERSWYLYVCAKYNWSKSELQEKIDNSAHLEVPLDHSPVVWYNNTSEQEARISQNDESAFSLPWQYMQESNGGVCDEGSGEKSGTEKGLPDCLRCDQPRRNRQSCLPSSPAQAGRAWGQMRWTYSPPTNESRLRRIRFSDWHGSGEPAEYAPYLWWGLRRQNAPPIRLYRPPRRCSRSVVHGRLRDNLAGCAGRLPRAS